MRNLLRNGSDVKASGLSRHGQICASFVPDEEVGDYASVSSVLARDGSLGQKYARMEVETTGLSQHGQHSLLAVTTIGVRLWCENGWRRA